MAPPSSGARLGAPSVDGGVLAQEDAAAGGDVVVGTVDAPEEPVVGVLHQDLGGYGAEDRLRLDRCGNEVVPELARPFAQIQDLGKEYNAGVGASPAVATLGPIGFLAHLLVPMLAVGLFLLMRGWRGQIVIKSGAALTLPSLLAVLIAIFGFVPLSKIGSGAAASLSDAILRDTMEQSTHLVQSAVVGVLVGLCLTGLNRREA